MEKALLITKRGTGYIAASVKISLQLSFLMRSLKADDDPLIIWVE